MASVNFYVGAYYLFFYVKRPQAREHLPFALACLSVGFYDVFTVGLYNARSLTVGIFWQRLQLDLIVAISVALIWFAAIFTQQKINRIVQGLIAWFCCLFLVSLFVNPNLLLTPANPAIKHINLLNRLAITYYEGEIGLIYQIEILSAVCAYVYLCYMFLQHYQKTKYHTLLLLLFCQLAYFFAVVNDSLVATQFYSFIYMSEYSFFLIIISMAYTLLDKFVNLHTAFETLNVSLEEKVQERTKEIQTLNQELRQLAEHDGLTGVYNRRFFNHYFEIEVKRARSYLGQSTRLLANPDQQNADKQLSFGLAILDIDHFKRINDIYGHLVGDSALKQITALIRQHIFAHDVLCRYGGDEFVLLLTRSSPNTMVQALEKIRQEIDEHSFVFASNLPSLHLTISVGLVNFDEALDKKDEEILKIADDRLLLAKNLGRNRLIYCDKV